MDKGVVTRQWPMRVEVKHHRHSAIIDVVSVDLAVYGINEECYCGVDYAIFGDIEVWACHGNSAVAVNYDILCYS